MKNENYIIKDKNGKPIKEGEKFTFSYKYENSIENFIGSFDWNDKELRYEMDIWNNYLYSHMIYNSEYMFDFELIENM